MSLHATRLAFEQAGSSLGAPDRVCCMQPLEGAIDSVADRTGFSGVVRVDRSGSIELAKAYGLADRGHEISNTIDTQFAIASGSKGLTALAVVSLIEDDSLDLTTTARSVLGGDLPLIGDDVTIEHLLSHRSGIGDYLDEDAGHQITDYLMPIPVHELATTEQYLAVLGGHATAFPAGERFAYCNGGYVVLALIAERTSGMPFHGLVRRRVCEPAGMGDTEFLRSDELPGRAALGYLTGDGSRTNVFHLPVRGSGDGGIYSTAADVSSLWSAFFARRIVSRDWVAEMVRPRSDVPRQSMRYGLGFWLHTSRDVVVLEGSDAGVSFRSVRDRGSMTTHTVISNTSEGAWPIARLLNERFVT
jgi:CubicO group peptidase (beta-lactamase class C family)